MCAENGIAVELTQLGHLGERSHRLFHVRDVERLQEGQGPARGFQSPAHVGVEAQRSRRPDRGAHLADELDVVLDGANAELPLESRRIVLLDHASAVGGDLGRGLLQPVAVGEVLGESDLGPGTRRQGAGGAEPPRFAPPDPRVRSRPPRAGCGGAPCPSRRWAAAGRSTRPSSASTSDPSLPTSCCPSSPRSASASPGEGASPRPTAPSDVVTRTIVRSMPATIPGAISYGASSGTFTGHASTLSIRPTG